MHERDLGALRHFFRLDDEDLAALAELEEAFDARADELVGRFYEHLMQFPATAALLADQGVRKRLLEQQRAYLISLTSPVIDEAYVTQRIRIGAAHERVGLETRWYLGAYSLYFSLLVPVICEALAADRERCERAIAALNKRLNFDSEIAIHQYIDRRETELRKLNLELEKAGRALSREVDETRGDLQRTQARAQAAEQLASVATLVTGLAHEIGTPMGVIRGHTEALESAVQGDRAEWRLGMILEQIDRITGIIQSLLNIARPRETLRVPISLQEPLETSLAFLTEKLKARGVEVEAQVEPAPLVIGDPERMQQVFLNLFINAIDAMAGGGTLRVGIRPSDDGEAVEVHVSDTGPGVNPGELESLFDPFYTTKPAGHGSGLGLVVVDGIVGDHGGEIEATCPESGGLHFTIRLPRATAAP